jgi:hypothetical protein
MTTGPYRIMAGLMTVGVLLTATALVRASGVGDDHV